MLFLSEMGNSKPAQQCPDTPIYGHYYVRDIYRWFELQRGVVANHRLSRWGFQESTTGSCSPGDRKSAVDYPIFSGTTLSYYQSQRNFQTTSPGCLPTRKKVAGNISASPPLTVAMAGMHRLFGENGLRGVGQKL